MSPQTAWITDTCYSENTVESIEEGEQRTQRGSSPQTAWITDTCYSENTVESIEEGEQRTQRGSRKYSFFLHVK